MVFVFLFCSKGWACRYTRGPNFSTSNNNIINNYYYTYKLFHIFFSFNFAKILTSSCNILTTLWWLIWCDIIANLLAVCYKPFFFLLLQTKTMTISSGVKHNGVSLTFSRDDLTLTSLWCFNKALAATSFKRKNYARRLFIYCSSLNLSGFYVKSVRTYALFIMGTGVSSQFIVEKMRCSLELIYQLRAYCRWYVQRISRFDVLLLLSSSDFFVIQVLWVFSLWCYSLALQDLYLDIISF